MEQEFFEKKFSRTGLVIGAALFIIAAGLIHLFLVPLHLEHSPAHGIFFALVGIAEVVWGFAFWRKPSAALYRIGMIMAGWLITLWVITIFLPAPFGHGKETVDLFGIVCRLSEGLGIASLAALLISGETQSEIKISAWRSIGSLLALSLILGGLTYGAALAAESVSPWAKIDNHEEMDHQHENQTIKQTSHSTDMSDPAKNNKIIGKRKKVKEAFIVNDFQEVDMTINASGYSPNVIVAKKGIPLKIKIHSEENAGCVSTVVFPEFGIEKTVSAGSSGVIEILPAQEGTFNFRCPMDMVRGELIVK